MKFLSTEIVEQEENRLEDLWYRKVPGFRKPNAMFHMTYDEIQEWAACKNDPIYFIEQYCLVYNHSENKIGNFKLREYQKKVINDFKTYRFNINAVSRQTGMTTVQAFLILHESIFNSNMSIINLSNKMACGVEKMDKIQEVYSRLPFFLKPGVNSYSKRRLEFDNGSQIIIESGELTSLKSRDIKNIILFLDDFAFMPPKYVESILNLMPPLAAMSGTNRIFISSTPNGKNHFKQMVEDAERVEGDPRKNCFNSNRIPYWYVWNRDKAWREKQISMLGSEKLFKQQYEICFNVEEEEDPKINSLRYIQKKKI
jgi:hypothetical protein